MNAAEFNKKRGTHLSYPAEAYELAEAYAAHETAAEKPERDNWILSINLELSNLRDWANREAKRAEAAEAERDRLKKDNLHKILAEQEISSNLRAERDRAVRALREIDAECDAILQAATEHSKITWGETILRIRELALSPVPVPAPTEEEIERHQQETMRKDTDRMLLNLAEAGPAPKGETQK